MTHVPTTAAHTKRTCVFCGGRPVTGEHHPPRWLNKHYRDARGTEWLAARRAGRKDEHWGSARTLTPHQVKAVCGVCNQGWMSVIESAVDPIVGPMTQGRRTELSESEQASIATWLVKSALITAAAVPAPHDHPVTYRTAYRDLYQTRMPGSAYVICIGGFERRDLTVLRFRDFFCNKVPGFMHVAALGHFMGYVLYRPPDCPPFRPDPKRFRQIWPHSEAQLTWPVGPSLNKAAAEVLCAGPFNVPPERWPGKWTAADG